MTPAHRRKVWIWTPALALGAVVVTVGAHGDVPGAVLWGAVVAATGLVGLLGDEGPLDD